MGIDGFERRREQCDRDFDRMRKGAAVWFVVVAVAALASVGFSVWVIIKLMSHYGVI